jgi:hypothetical protein
VPPTPAALSSCVPCMRLPLRRQSMGLHLSALMVPPRANDSVQVLAPVGQVALRAGAPCLHVRCASAVHAWRCISRACLMPLRHTSLTACFNTRALCSLHMMRPAVWTESIVCMASAARDIAAARRGRAAGPREARAASAGTRRDGGLAAAGAPPRTRAPVRPACVASCARACSPARARPRARARDSRPRARAAQSRRAGTFRPRGARPSA